MLSYLIVRLSEELHGERPHSFLSIELPPSFLKHSQAHAFSRLLKSVEKLFFSSFGLLLEALSLNLGL